MDQIKRLNELREWKGTLQPDEADEHGWRHVRIVLEPLNRSFRPIELTEEDEEAVAVVAEFVEVVNTGATAKRTC